MTDPRALAAAPVALLALLLLVATSYEGAFDIRVWAPVALFALVLLIALIATGGAAAVSRPATVAIAAIWAFAGWSLLSATWAESTQSALEGGAIAVLYAALVTVGLVAVPRPRQMRAIGYALIAGVVAIAVVTLVRMHLEGVEMFVGGRLDSPVGYRNATATLFALAFWPLIGVAVTRGRNPTLRATAFAASTLCLGLAFLTQSRGVIVALAAGGVVALALGTERIRRAFLALLALLGVLLLSGPLLVAYRTFEEGPGPVTESDVASATDALTFLVVDALVIGLLLALLDGGLRASVRNLERARRIAVGLLVLGAVVLPAGAVLAAGNPLDFAREKIDEFQAVESRSSDFSRILSTGGERYDLWRIALDEFVDHPLLGAGEGNYAVAYYAERDTDRNLDSPHSLPLRVLAELGIVGAALFATFLAALAVALVRGVRARLLRPRGQAVYVRHTVVGLAAAGAVVLGQALVDWVWFVPGVTGIGLLCLALATGTVARVDPLEAAARRPARGPGAAAPRSGAGEGAGLRLRLRGVGRTAWVGLRPGLPLAGLSVAALLVLALFLSDYFVREARTAASPEAAIENADRALSLDPWALTPRYLRAAALEERGEVGAARAELRAALRTEPGNFVVVGLLGDLEARAGNAGRAARRYRRAAALNPRDVGLEELAREARTRAGRAAQAAGASESEEASG